MQNESGYTSVFSWRYGSDEMRGVFSERHRYELWRRIWVALARAQHAAGLVSAEELADLEAHQDEIDIDRILEIEGETRHDVVAGIREFAEKATVGGGKIHFGATSMDVVDNSEVLRLKEALEVVTAKVDAVLAAFAEQIEKYAKMPTIGYTHLQPAEPTTVGYRLAFHADELLSARDAVLRAAKLLRGKGMKGAVGTSASYQTALAGTEMDAAELERRVMEDLGLPVAPVASQVVPRSQEYQVLAALNLVASALGKFGGDVRILQSANVAEWSEPFGKSQVGSSAMPFKKNPINSEKICSLARYVAALPAVVLENATVSYLERTLDDSANRRVVTPDAFLATDEILVTAQKVVNGLVVNEARVARNLETFGPFAATEAILMEAVTAGASRQEMHETLREISLEAWQQVQTGQANPMKDLLPSNPDVAKYVPAERVTELLDVSRYVGLAPERAKATATRIREALK